MNPLEIITCCKGKKRKAFILPLNVSHFYLTVSLCISSLAPKIWELLSVPLKNEVCLNSFNRKKKFWITGKYPCQLCQKYKGNVGFM